MASGRAGSGSRSFDFGSDDVLCSYDDLDHDASNGNRPNSAGKDLRERRTGRSLTNSYPQNDGFSKQDMVSIVDRCMKKYTDNLLTVLEGISGRLSQLEVYCYNLERAVGDLRSDLVHDKKETDSKLSSLEKHLQEVHRSVQILRDKQELADTQKELAKLQLVQKGSSENLAPSASEQKKQSDSTDASNQQLALALPQQAAPQAPVSARAPEQSQALQPVPSSANTQQAPALTQGVTYLPQQNQLRTQTPHQQQNTLQPELQYAPQRPQSPYYTVQPPQSQSHVANPSQPPQFAPQFQQQWVQQTSQPFPQQAVQPPQGNSPSQYQPQPPAYPPYPSQKASPETFQGSGPMPPAYSMVPHSAGGRTEPAPFGYGGPGNSMQPPPSTHNAQRQTQPQTSQGPTGLQMSSDGGYMAVAPYSPQPNVHGYMMYPNDGRVPHPQSVHPGNYTESMQNRMPPSGLPNARPMSSHPFGEFVEKAVSMGYPREQVMNAIYRMEESGQSIDFNKLLDMLNARAPGY